MATIRRCADVRPVWGVAGSGSLGARESDIRVWAPGYRLRQKHVQIVGLQRFAAAARRVALVNKFYRCAGPCKNDRVDSPHGPSAATSPGARPEEVMTTPTAERVLIVED